MGFGRLEGWLRERAADDPEHLVVLPPVPPDELLPWTASADVTFVGQPPRTLNQRYNLPNKLFESLMAGVPVVVSKDNEQCRLVSAGAGGWMRRYRLPGGHRSRARRDPGRTEGGTTRAPRALPYRGTRAV